MQGLLRVGRKRGQGWTAKQITFVGGTCHGGSGNVTSFHKNFAFTRRYYEAKWGNGDGESGRASAGGPEHVGRDVYIVIGKE